MKVIAIIPARSGSKGIQNKNIKELNGKPLFSYTINAAKESEIFDVIHVSTDSPKYAEIARDYGADVPFLRSKETATDNATTWDAVKYVLENYENLGKKFDVIIVLQPTSPLRNAKDIKGAFKFFKDKEANMISSVCEMEHSPLWSNTLPNDLSMKDFEDEKISYMPRQSLPTFYRENGAIYILKTTHLYSSANIYKDKCYAYIMEKSHSIDIDDISDFYIAEALMEKYSIR